MDTMKRCLNNQINLSSYFGKRYKKILPFYAILVVIDLCVSPSLSALYEGFADIKLLFGFLPNPDQISVIGVGWFFGLIFMFYLCFPFYCVLLRKQKKSLEFICY